MAEYPEFKCSACGYIPDDEDLEKTGYHLSKCDTCGQENVCDLCLFYMLVEVDFAADFDKWWSKSECPKCSSRSGFGKLRKELLLEEYDH